jgi:hypothetical protein
MSDDSDRALLRAVCLEKQAERYMKLSLTLGSPKMVERAAQLQEAASARADRISLLRVSPYRSSE